MCVCVCEREREREREKERERERGACLRAGAKGIFLTFPSEFNSLQKSKVQGNPKKTMFCMRCVAFYDK